jgi:hypothetical protein
MAFAGALFAAQAEPNPTIVAIEAISESNPHEQNARMEPTVLEAQEVLEGPPRSHDEDEPISVNPVSSFQSKSKPINPRIDPSAVRREPVEAVSDEELCNALVASARAHDVPVGFFGNLIWQESRFDSGSISRAGAQGVAQFMPGTAARFGLKNPFDPFEALPASARLLRQLSEQFGNFGLAAAAYNAGPGRVLKWLANRGELPRETRAYVRIITGRPAEDWRKNEPIKDSAKIADQLPCRDMPAFAELKEAIASDQSNRAKDGAAILQIRRVREWAVRTTPRVLRSKALQIARYAPAKRGAESAPRAVNVATLMSRRRPNQRTSTRLESEVTQGTGNSEVHLRLLKATAMPAKLRRFVAREATSDRSRNWQRAGKKRIAPVASARSGRSV